MSLLKRFAGVGCLALAALWVAEPAMAGSGEPITSLFKSAKKKGQRAKRSDSIVDMILGRRSGSRDNVQILGPDLGGDEFAPAKRKTKKRAKKTDVAVKQPEEKTRGGASGGDDNENDPEANPIVITDNLTYVPDKRVHLGAESFVEVASAVEPLALPLREALLDAKSGLSAEAADRDAMLANYAARGFKPVFATPQGLSDRGLAVLATLSKAADEGLEPEDYLPAGLSSFEAASELQGASADKLARLDIALTAKALLYARHASGGKIIPKRVSIYFDVEPPRVAPAVALTVLTYSPFPSEYLAGLHPTHPAYAALRKALVGLREIAEAAAAEPIASGKRVILGQDDPRIVLVRDRLERLGIIEPDLVAREISPELLDQTIEAGLKAFQRQNKIKASGQLDSLTIRALNANSPGKQIRILALNMERLRWLPRDLGRRHVIVNQAAFELTLMKDGAPAWRTEVVVGRPSTQTFLFHDEMETVVFNPYWGLPHSIIWNEYMPKLRRDPSYLDRKGYQVVNAKGKVVSSSSIKWSKYKLGAPVSVQQPPSAWNALGKVKFLFPNAHAIYMHDTPQKHLFKQSVRAFSHGCVRVQDPTKFAELILGWDTEKVDKSIATGKTANIAVDGKLPVHMTYFTAWPSPEGGIDYFADIYGRDKKLEKALQNHLVASR